MLTGIAPFAAFGHSYGPAPRVAAAPGDNSRACTQCHAGTLNSGTGSVKILLQSGAFYVPGVKQRITVQVADPAQQRWGFELTARLNSDLEKGQAGDLVPVDNMTQVICEDSAPKPCASGPQFITHTSVGTRNGTPNGASFQFDWTPPATNAGPVTLYAAGNAANGNGSPHRRSDLHHEHAVDAGNCGCANRHSGQYRQFGDWRGGADSGQFLGHDLRHEPLRHHARLAGQRFHEWRNAVFRGRSERNPECGQYTARGLCGLRQSDAGELPDAEQCGCRSHHGTSQESCGNQRSCDDYGAGRRAAVVYLGRQERIGRSRGRRATRQGQLRRRLREKRFRSSAPD